MPGWYVKCAQHIVHATDFSLFAIDFGFPSPWEIHLGEHSHAAVACGGAVGERIWCVGGFVDGVAWFNSRCLAQHRSKTLVGNSLCGGVQVVEGIHFLNSTVHVGEGVDKPCVAQRSGVEHHCGVVLYYILGVEHINHLGIALANLTVDEVLIACELGCMVAADVLVEV